MSVSNTTIPKRVFAVTLNDNKVVKCPNGYLPSTVEMVYAEVLLNCRADGDEVSHVRYEVGPQGRPHVHFVWYTAKNSLDRHSILSQLEMIPSKSHDKLYQMKARMRYDCKELIGVRDLYHWINYIDKEVDKNQIFYEGNLHLFYAPK